MAEQWPATLPQCFVGGTVTWQLGDGRLKTPMEAGPAKGRRRTSAVSDVLRGQMKMTTAQWAELKEFYKTTLQEADTINFPNPDDSDSGADLLVRVGDAPPGAEKIGRGYYIVSLELEVLP